MRIFHPHTTLRGAARENSFIVMDDHGQEKGHGWLTVWNAVDLLPNRPLRIQFEMQALPDARDILFGALMTRARLLCAQQPGIKARINAVCKPEDQDMLNFFKQNGMNPNDGNDLFVASVLPLPFASPVPTGTKMEPISLRTDQEKSLLLQRVNRYSFEAHDAAWLEEAMRLPHFMSLGVFLASGRELVGEVLVTGEANEAVLEVIYTRPEWQRKGVAMALMAAAKAELRQRGAMGMRVISLRSNRPMLRLLQKNQFDWKHMLQKMPYIDI